LALGFYLNPSQVAASVRPWCPVYTAPSVRLFLDPPMAFSCDWGGWELTV